MRITRFVLALLFISLFSCNSGDDNTTASIIIPKPTIHMESNGTFIINANTTMSFPDELEVPALFFKALLPFDIQINTKQEAQDIVLEIDSTIANPEGYKLDISSKGIHILASSSQGAFYAVQSFRQLLPISIENGSYGLQELTLKCQTISDSPKFKYRGMHLDVGRHMFSVDFIKKYIDMLAMLKLNTFHWHLTEDQGWRIEIESYPKLNEIASYRKETLVGHYSEQPHQFDGKRYGGYYSKADIKDVVAYAQKHFITVIPEIEMPGHAQAAIAAYPQLGCTGKQVDVATTWGVFDHIYCSKEETFNFLETVLDEVLELFPSEYIHIGGDEAPKTNWKSCNKCQNRMAEEGLADAHELQSYFINRIETYLNGKGRQIIGWDEILEGGLAPNATVMSWRGVQGGIEAAKAKHKVIMTPTSHLYFDYYQSDGPSEPLAIGGFLPLEKVYGYNPIPEELTAEEAQYILGAQGNVWTEYMPNEKQVEYMVLPRMAALSEVVWTQSELKNYPDFVKRLEHFNKRLEALDINHANHLYEVTGKLETTHQGLAYSLKTLTHGKTIRYTVDGSVPTEKSDVYTKPIAVDKSMTIKAAVFNSENPLGTIYTEKLNLHKAVGKNMTLSVAPHKAYNAGGKEALVNSINGSDERFGDKEWLGFWGDDVEITIDLGEEMDVNSIDMRFFNAHGQWIYRPKMLSIQMKNYSNIHLLEASNDLIMETSYLMKARTRFITLKVENYGIIPEGLQGAGNKAWTFIDEIIVN